MKIDYIKEAFNDQPVVMVSGKKYCINPLTDHVPITKPELLQQVVNEISIIVDFESADFLVGEEDRGGYICALTAFAVGKPFTLTKWNPSGFEGEVCIDFRNSYTHGNLYLNGIKELAGKKAIIVEDLIDTGGTIVSMVNLLRANNIEVVDIVAVAEKTDYSGAERIKKETGITPKFLVSFSSKKELSKVIKRI
ncbi:MAG: phosphoribosyltransferase family protein [bacterium]